MIQVLSLEQIVHKIENLETFDALVSDGSFAIKIEAYVPIVCFAIHNGHQFSKGLSQKCLLNDYERWYEEDPLTYEFIKTQPIVLTGNDSRYAYDLNRSTDEAIYKIAWGKSVWKEPLNDAQRKESLNKHAGFYYITDMLLIQLHKLHLNVVAFDMHSFNYKRLSKHAPVFNLGTILIKEQKYRSLVDLWLSELQAIEISEIVTEVEENDVFIGDGNLAQHITEMHSNTLVLVTEIKKIYCDELTGEIYNSILNSISIQLNNSIHKFKILLENNYGIT